MHRQWKICMHFDNGTTHLLSVKLSDVAAFIKKSTAKNKGVKMHTTLPLNSWLVDIVFDKAAEDYPIARLMDATISQRG